MLAAAAKFLQPDPGRDQNKNVRPLALVVSSAFGEIRQDGPADIAAKFSTLARTVHRLDDALAALSAVDHQMLSKHFSPGTLRVLHIRDDLPVLAAAAKAIAQSHPAEGNKLRRPNTFLHGLADRLAVFFAAFTGQEPPKGYSQQSSYFRFCNYVFKELRYGSKPRILMAASKRFVAKPLPDGRLLRKARKQPSVC